MTIQQHTLSREDFITRTLDKREQSLDKTIKTVWQKLERLENIS